VQAACVALSLLDANLGGLSFPIPRPFGSRVLGLLAVAGSVALGNAGLGLFAVLMLLELGAGEAYDDQYHPEYVTTYSEPALGLRVNGKEITNIFPFDADGKPLQGVHLVDQDGDPVVATRNDDPNLEARLPLDGDGNEVENRYPQVQQQLDPATGQRVPGPTPEFHPPPGPVRQP
jgi:hypothetical protein